MVMSGVADANTFSIDVRNLPAGAYMIRMSSESGVFGKRFLVE